jgi:hypothetical protein
MRRRELMLGAMLAARRSPAATTAAIKTGGKEAARFYYGGEWDKPFLYPIRTVSGRVLSRGYPLEKREGEQTDHAWHRGFWWGHGIINGEDFWRELGREKTSRLVVQGNPAVSKNGIAATMAMTTPAGKRLGTARQRFTIEDRGKLRFLDASIAIAADAGTALTFGDTDDGGFGFRLDDAFREDRGARLRNSEGLAGAREMWGKPARWVDYAANIGGVAAGVAVFDHPANLRHPTGWHARNYSLCAANPFAAKSFSRGKAPDGSYTLESGKELRLRYRAVIYDGALEADEIDRLFRGWAGK